ncbi:hypothetical protein AOLI_G00172350 [Acnodon oligacanthus]
MANRPSASGDIRATPREKTPVMAEMKAKILSSLKEDITTLLRLSKDVAGLQERCVDLAGRMRRSNIRILSVTEGSGSSSPAAVSKLLKEALSLEKEVIVDRSHRGLQPRQQGGKPCAIVAKLHYHQDCVDILCRAREAGSLQYNGTKIFIFPDYPPSVARAKSAFSEVKNILRGQTGMRFGLFYPARLRITHNGTEKEFRDPAEAMAYVKANMTQTG